MLNLGHHNVLQSLRKAGLRPTICRITTLQVFNETPDAALSVEDVFMQLGERGIRANLATVYRVTRELEQNGLLLRLFAQARKQLFRFNASVGDAGPLWAVNCNNGERAVLRDAALQARLVAALIDSGLALDGGRIAIEFYCAAVQPAVAPPIGDPPQTHRTRRMHKLKEVCHGVTASAVFHGGGGGIALREGGREAAH